MDRLSSHVKGHLVDYIRKEMEHGYSIGAIREVLLNYHHNNIVTEAIKQLEKENFSVKHKKSKTKKLEREMFYEVVNLLRDYYAQQKARGYTAQHVKEAMLRYGHGEDTVIAAIEAVEYGKDPVYEEPFHYERVPAIIFPVTLLGFIVFVLWLSSSAQEDPVRLALLFSPILIIPLALKGLKPVVSNKQSLLGLPVVLCLMGYLAMFTGKGLFVGVEAELISGLNFIVSFFYSVLYIGVTPEVVESIKEEEELIEEMEEEGKASEDFVVAKEKHERKSAQEIEKLIEEDIKSGRHGMQPIALPESKMRTRVEK